jgi:diguanylate cyclase (GGDEF)-like protein
MNWLRVGLRRVTRSTIALFAVVSLIPMVSLGWFLSVENRQAMEARTADVYGSMTAGIFELAKGAIVAPEDFAPGATFSPERAEALQGLLHRLGGDSSTVRIRIVDRSGRVLFANQPEDADTTLPSSDQFIRALHGGVATRFVRGSISMSMYQPSTLIEIYLPVSFDDGRGVRGVVVASGVDQSVVAKINGDVRRSQIILAVGLMVLWLVLLPIVVSVSRRLRRSAAHNRHLALHDSLTGLPNRNLLEDRLEHAIAGTARTGEHVGLLLLDLDSFKDVNDTLGHAKGDELLQNIAARLTSSVRSCDTVSRLGGDEFAIVLPGISDPAQLALAAERLAANLTEPVTVDGIDVAVHASIGGSMFPQHAETPDGLLRDADIAMYAAKSAKESFVIYSADLDSHSPSRLALVSDFRRALDDDGQLHLHYQPVASPRSGRVHAVEALVRWEHPARGPLTPDAFIPMAEQSGLISRMSAKVLDMALAQARTWLDAGLDISVAVNLSAADLCSPTLLENVHDALTRHGVPADRLELEVTETAVLECPEAAVNVLDVLRALGVTVALDDFGTGYSSLTYLKRLHPDRLKIDRTFVGGMGDEPADAEIVRSLVELAHSLSIGVTAEGVETAETWDLLSGLDCDLVQGYFLSRPMPPADVTAWLEQQSSIAPVH